MHSHLSKKVFMFTASTHSCLVEIAFFTSANFMTSYIFILFYKFLTLFNGLGSFLCKIIRRWNFIAIPVEIIKLENWSSIIYFYQKFLMCCTDKTNIQDVSLKDRSCHLCFPVNFAKFLRTPFLKNTTGRLLLKGESYIKDIAKHQRGCLGYYEDIYFDP